MSGAHFRDGSRGLITRTLASGRIIKQEILAETKPVTDGHNIFSVLFATSQMALRKLAVEKCSPDVLVNRRRNSLLFNPWESKSDPFVSQVHG